MHPQAHTDTPTERENEGKTPGHIHPPCAALRVGMVPITDLGQSNWTYPPTCALGSLLTKALLFLTGITLSCLPCTTRTLTPSALPSAPSTSPTASLGLRGPSTAAMRSKHAAPKRPSASCQSPRSEGQR